MDTHLHSLLPLLKGRSNEPVRIPSKLRQYGGATYPATVPYSTLIKKKVY